MVIINSQLEIWFGLVYGAERHFQQYFSYIGGEIGVPGENH